jgi:hypothetical protein
MRLSLGVTEDLASPRVSWERPEDNYTEGELIWLDADTKNPRIERREKVPG